MHCRLNLKKEKEPYLFARRRVPSTVASKVRESVCDTRAAWKSVLAEFGQNVPCVTGRRIHSTYSFSFFRDSRASISRSLSLSPFRCIANRYLYVHGYPWRITRVMENWRNWRSIYFRERERQTLVEFSEHMPFGNSWRYSAPISLITRFIF